MVSPQSAWRGSRRRRARTRRDRRQSVDCHFRKNNEVLWTSSGGGLIKLPADQQTSMIRNWPASAPTYRVPSRSLQPHRGSRFRLRRFACRRRRYRRRQQHWRPWRPASRRRRFWQQRQRGIWRRQCVRRRRCCSRGDRTRQSGQADRHGAGRAPHGGDQTKSARACLDADNDGGGTRALSEYSFVRHGTMPAFMSQLGRVSRMPPVQTSSA